MAVGRKLLLKKDSTVLAGLRTKSLAWSGESVDMTTAEDDGKRLLDELSGQEQIDISIDGIMKGSTLRDLVLGSSSKMLTDVTIEWPASESGATPAKLSGDFRLSAYEEGAPYNDAITFSGTLESSGDWTYTAEASA
jgi:predicted secreted protein